MLNKVKVNISKIVKNQICGIHFEIYFILKKTVFSLFFLIYIERPTFKTCSNDFFRCSKDANDFCINKTQICDIEQDCLNGEDEKQGCGE